MKKILLLLTFVCFLFAGNQSVFAQSTIEKQKTVIKNADDSVKKEASKVIGMLERQAKVTNAQKNDIYEVFAVVAKKKKNIESIENKAQKKAKLTKLEAYLNERLSQVLTSEQFALYKKKMKAY